MVFSRFYEKNPPYHKIDSSRIFLQKLDENFNNNVQILYLQLCQLLLKWDADINIEAN